MQIPEPFNNATLISHAPNNSPPSKIKKCIKKESEGISDSSKSIGNNYSNAIYLCLRIKALSRAPGINVHIYTYGAHTLRAMRRARGESRGSPLCRSPALDIGSDIVAGAEGRGSKKRQERERKKSYC